jgi:hypothetical protein
MRLLLVGRIRIGIETRKLLIVKVETEKIRYQFWELLRGVVI